MEDGGTASPAWHPGAWPVQEGQTWKRGPIFPSLAKPGIVWLWGSQPGTWMRPASLTFKALGRPAEEEELQIPQPGRPWVDLMWKEVQLPQLDSLGPVKPCEG